MERQAKNTELKVCGLTRAEDTAFCVQRGVDFLGFNFYAGSKRHVSPDVARKLWLAAKRAVSASPSRAAGVYVGAQADEILAVVRAFPELAVLQIQGDYPAPFYRDLRWALDAEGRQDLAIWRVAHVTGGTELAAYATLGVELVLFDSAAVPQGASVPGGSGVAFDWAALASLPSSFPFGVAGGIKPGHWPALARFAPRVVDVCSGVETSPGVKDHAKIEALIEEVQHRSV